VGTAIAMYLNAAGLMWVQLACATFMVPASIALKVFFTIRWGISGLSWAMVIAYTAFVIVPLTVLLVRRRSGFQFLDAH
jgi:hypothetical protein